MHHVQKDAEAHIDILWQTKPAAQFQVDEASQGGPYHPSCVDRTVSGCAITSRHGQHQTQVSIGRTLRDFTPAHEG